MERNLPRNRPPVFRFVPTSTSTPAERYCARAGLLAFGPDAVPRSCQAHLSEANSAGVPMDCTGVCYFDDDHKKVRLSFFFKG